MENTKNEKANAKRDTVFIMIIGFKQKAFNQAVIKHIFHKYTKKSAYLRKFAENPHTNQ